MWTDATQPETAWNTTNLRQIIFAYDWDDNYDLEHLTYDGYLDTVTPLFDDIAPIETAWS